MKQLEVQIMGQSYLLGCPENGDERLLMAVNKVDQAMCKIRDAGKIKARDRIAVLAALNLAFELSDRPAQAQQSAIPFPLDDKAAESSERVRALLDRLDAALGTDGHLL
jgi:cell division protein ZapA